MFNINQFKLSINMLFADKGTRHIALAAMISDNLESAAVAWLCGGSSSLADALAIISTSTSKTSVARKLRATIKAIEFQFSDGAKVWATLAGSNLVPAADLIGGNSPRVKPELLAREASCVAFGEIVRNSIAEAFAPVVPDAERDPLAGFGVKSEEASIKALIIKVGKANDDQLHAAIDRVALLLETLQSANDVRLASAAEEKAAVAAAAEEAAAKEASIRDQLRAEMRAEMIKAEIKGIADSKILALAA